MSEASLHACFPALAEFPRAVLGHAPTAVEPLPRLSESVGSPLAVKRDDCTALGMGGNKVRQLEFYMGEARSAGADCVLITGAVQSNFVRTAAAAARRLGMDIHVQLEDRVQGMDETYRRSGNVLLNRLYGATVHHYPEGEDESGADAALEALAEGLRARGARPYVIHLGIDHAPLGGLGYVVAAWEYVRQMSALDRPPGAVVIPSGSGLTHAGFLVGLRAMDVAVPVYGICVRREAGAQRARVLRRAAQIAALAGRADLEFESEVRVCDAVLAPGYGRVSEPVVRAMTLAARLEGLLVDPVYSGKTLAGWMHLAASGELPAGSGSLFVHTGGVPALFGYETMLSGRLA